MLSIALIEEFYQKFLFYYNIYFIYKYIIYFIFILY